MQRVIGPSLLVEHPGHSDQSVHGHRVGAVHVTNVGGKVTGVAFHRPGYSRSHANPTRASVGRLNKLLTTGLKAKKLRQEVPLTVGKRVTRRYGAAIPGAHSFGEGVQR